MVTDLPALRQKHNKRATEIWFANYVITCPTREQTKRKKEEEEKKKRIEREKKGSFWKNPRADEAGVLIGAKKALGAPLRTVAVGPVNGMHFHAIVMTALLLGVIGIIMPGEIGTLFRAAIHRPRKYLSLPRFSDYFLLLLSVFFQPMTGIISVSSCISWSWIILFRENVCNVIIWSRILILFLFFFSLKRLDRIQFLWAKILFRLKRLRFLLCDDREFCTSFYSFFFFLKDWDLFFAKIIYSL